MDFSYNTISATWVQCDRLEVSRMGDWGPWVPLCQQTTCFHQDSDNLRASIDIKGFGGQDIAE
jgi:hypothetical protein